MGTFHSVFIRFLREFSESLGYPSTFTIYDTSDSVSAIKTCLKELQLDDKVYKPKDVLSRISMAKNNLVQHRLTGEIQPQFKMMLRPRNRESVISMNFTQLSASRLV
jgi:DNA helicase-2/ATP-dependent DNA helicase PcrA